MYFYNTLFHELFIYDKKLLDLFLNVHILTLFNVKIMNKKLQLNPDSSFHARVSVQTNKILTNFFF